MGLPMTILGAAIAATLTTITPSVVVTMGASGIAPLKVWFDARSTTSSRTARAFHDISYYWDFGDGSAGVWTKGDQASKNNDSGPLVWHVYPEGVFTPSCIMFDGGSIAPWTGSAITATSFVTPAVWTGGKTILASTSGTFTCGSVTGSTNIAGSADTQWDTIVAALNSAAAAGTVGPARVLLREGERFKASLSGFSQYIKSAGGPVWIGTYNDDGPKVGGTKATIEALATGSGAGHGVGVVVLGSGEVGYSGMNDVRFTDIAFDVSLVPGATGSYCVSFRGQWTHALFMNCPLIGFNKTGVDMNHANISNATAIARGYTMPNHIGFQECDQSGQHISANNNLNTWGYVCGIKVGVMGCALNARGDAETSSHCLRAIQFDGLVISHNDFSYPGAGRLCIKAHSDGVLLWGLDTTGGTGGAFSPSSTTNGGKGDFRRPINAVGTGNQAVDGLVQIWRCTTAGTTDATEPAWNYTPGSTTNDGTVVWTECSSEFYAGTSVPTDMAGLRDATHGNERLYSSDLIARGNKFINGTGAWTISVGARDNLNVELVYNALIEDNFLPPVAGTTTATLVELGGARGVTVRNNLVDMSNWSSIQMILASWGGGNCYANRDVFVHNNSAVCTATSSASLTVLKVDAYTRNPNLKNNLLYNTSGKTATMVTGSAHAGFPLVASNNTGDVGTFTTDPKFSGALTAAAGWQITDATSYTKNAGAAVPVWKDFFGAARASASMDIGASEQL